MGILPAKSQLRSGLVSSIGQVGVRVINEYTTKKFLRQKRYQPHIKKSVNRLGMELYRHLADTKIQSKF